MRDMVGIVQDIDRNNQVIAFLRVIGKMHGLVDVEQPIGQPLIVPKAFGGLVEKLRRQIGEVVAQVAAVSR